MTKTTFAFPDDDYAEYVVRKICGNIFIYGNSK